MVSSLYVHIPFCRKKCRYCDFISFEETESVYKAYVDALRKELAYKKKEAMSGRLKTIFIGGGTPTVLPLVLFEKLLVAIKNHVDFEDDYEYTMEANPESLSAEQLALMKQYGVNRLSLGVQSFVPETLEFLGRAHCAQKAKEAFLKARAAGFSNISLDLIYGIPGESMDQWLDTLNQALALKPEHLSLYQLKIEEHTPLYQKYEVGLINEFPDEQAEEVYQLNIKALLQAEYSHYEISNFAKPGYQSAHNLVYWNYQPYLAAGFGAVAFFGTHREEFAGSFTEYCNIQAFTKDSFSKEHLTKQEQICEYLIMNLRKTDGFALDDFEKRYKESFLKTYRKQTEKMISQGLVVIEEKRVFLTSKGRLLGNLVFEEFIV